MLKKAVAISLFICGAFILSLILAYFSLDQGSQVGPVVSITPPIPSLSPGETFILSVTEVAKHNQASDCWIIVSNNVYNVTSEIRNHPGGVSEIIPTCGTDATTAFLTRGGTGRHSNTADQQLNNLFIGKLNQVFASGLISSNRPQTQSSSLPNPVSGGDEIEDD